MDSSLYSILAMGMRYWFAALAVVFVFRAWRASVTDNRNARLLRDWTQRASCIGELLVLGDENDSELEGEKFPVPRECMLGSSRTADIRIAREGIEKRHIWMEQRVDCVAVSPIGGAEVSARGQSGPVLIIKDGQKFKLAGITFLLILYEAEGAIVVEPDDEFDEPDEFDDSDEFGGEFDDEEFEYEDIEWPEE